MTTTYRLIPIRSPEQEEIERLMAENESARKHWANELNNVQALVAEVAQIKSENSYLKAGCDTYEQIIADLKAENEALRKALGGMLFAFDDGVGLDWSAELLDHARTLCPAAEFKP